jgi:Domain of unknown function (DUF1883)
MNYLYYEFHLNTKDIVQVTLDKQANVRLLDSSNYYKYKESKEYTYYGGLALKSPLRLAPPYAGYWYVVIDLQGFTGTVNASVNIIRNT